MIETMHPSDRYTRQLEALPKRSRNMDGERDWSGSAHKVAFHRAVVDHALQQHGASFGRLEGRSIAEQAAIICRIIDAAASP